MEAVAAAADCAGEAFLLGAFGVEFEEAGEDFVADLVGPAVASGLLAPAPFAKTKA